jgi:amidase
MTGHGGSLPASEWAYRSIGELVLALRNKEISARELTDQFVARIEALDGDLNAVVVRDFERAREAARAADAALARGERQPLLGIPVTIKESYNIAGLPTTWGLPHSRNYMPLEDALAVKRLKAAGAIILGKTNVPLSLADWQSYNDIYGMTSNPWDKGRSPGGSSGGSSAAHLPPVLDLYRWARTLAAPCAFQPISVALAPINRPFGSLRRAASCRQACRNG